MCFARRIIALLLVLCLTPALRAGAVGQAERETPVVRAVQSALPAVVNLSTSKKISVPRRGLFLFPSPFDDLFEMPRLRQEVQQTSLGSSVLVDNDGHLLTNYHVINMGNFGPADEILAFVYGEDTPRQADFLGGDPTEDIAVLRLHGDPPQAHLPFGRSDDLMVGETVIAIGNALGNASTVTQGIISYIGRRIDDGKGSSLTGLIQTDADINPGNSGGPLLNINSELIGINTAISTPTGGSVGLGFAIPVNRARAVYDYVVHKRLTLAARLGIRIANLDGDYKRVLYQFYPELIGHDDMPGVMVELVSDGPLEGKIAQFTVITYLQGRRVRSVDDFVLLDSERNGSELALSYFYRGKFGDVTFPVSGHSSVVEEFEWNGMTVRALDDFWRHRLGLSADSQAVVVTNVKWGSAANKSRMEKGDVVTGLSPTRGDRNYRLEVSNLAEFRRATEALRDVPQINVFFTRITGNRAAPYRTEIRQKST